MTTTNLDWAPVPLRPLVAAAVAAARADSRVVGLAVAGSGAVGAMDEFSDLDLVVVCRHEDHPHLLRDAPAFAAGLGPLLSSFTGEHVREPRLLLCLFGPPLIRVDLKFVAVQDLDYRLEDGRVLWQRDGALDAAFRRTSAVWQSADPQWMEARFWTWIHSGAAEVGRGEFFHCLEELTFLRRTVNGPLIARSRGERSDGVRRIEQIAPDLVPAMMATIGNHTALGCITALHATIELYQRLRDDYPEFAYVTTLRPDLVILNLLIDHTDLGWQFLERLKADPATTAVPVLVSTGDVALLERVADRLAAWTCGTLRKPFNLEKFLARVRLCLGEVPCPGPD